MYGRYARESLVPGVAVRIDVSLEHEQEWYAGVSSKVYDYGKYGKGQRFIYLIWSELLNIKQLRIAALADGRRRPMVLRESQAAVARGA